MFGKFNLKKKIYLTIIILKLALFFLAILSAFTFNNINLEFTFALGGIAIISIVLLQQLENLFSRLIDTYMNNVLVNNDIISSNILSAILTQKTFTEENFSKITNIVNYTDKLKIETYATKDITKTIIEKQTKTIELSENEIILIKNALDKMYVIKQKIQVIAELILELSEHVQLISNNIDIVEDISEQTNMLALNAAVEAARAGENGKGFAIVATEIRKLADANKQATTKITDLVRETQNATNSTIMAAEEGSKEVENTLAIGLKTNNNIAELKNNISQTIDETQKVLNELDQQFNYTEYLIQASQEIKVDMKDSNNALKEDVKTIQKAINSTSKTHKEITDSWE